MPPKNHIISKVIMKFVHEQRLHAGPKSTLAAIWRRFWIISGRSAVRQVLHSCYLCFRANFNLKWVTCSVIVFHPFLAFYNLGVDYAKPVYVNKMRERQKKLKAYIALFVCFSTKSVHIAWACVLTTQEFVVALKGFTSRKVLFLTYTATMWETLSGQKTKLQI